MNKLGISTLKLGYTQNRIIGIIISRQIGKSLLGSLLEYDIVMAYKDGMTYLQIGRKYLSKQYRISQRVTICALSYFIQNTELLTDNDRKELASEHHLRSAKKSGKISAKVRGFIPWDNLLDRKYFDEKKHKANMPEIAYAYNLSLDPKYKRSSKVDCGKLTKEVNKVYHNKRTKKAISMELSRFRKTFFRTVR